MDIKEEVAVEVGPGMFATISALRRDFLEGKGLVYLERDPERARGVKREVNGLYMGEEKAPRKVIQGDINSMPFSNSSISLIFMKDVLGQQGLLDSRTFRQIDVGEIEQIAKECSRVLRGGGKLIVMEVTESIQKSKEELIEIFGKAHFELKESDIYKKKDLQKLFDEGTVVGSSISQIAHPESFALVFTKK